MKSIYSIYSPIQQGKIELINYAHTQKKRKLHGRVFGMDMCVLEDNLLSPLKGFELFRIDVKTGYSMSSPIH
jgi:hypothetical protein